MVWRNFENFLEEFSKKSKDFFSIQIQFSKKSDIISLGIYLVMFEEIHLGVEALPYVQSLQKFYVEFLKESLDEYR